MKSGELIINVDDKKIYWVFQKEVVGRRWPSRRVVWTFEDAACHKAMGAKGKIMNDKPIGRWCVEIDEYFILPKQ